MYPTNNLGLRQFFLTVSWDIHAKRNTHDTILVYLWYSMSKARGKYKVPWKATFQLHKRFSQSWDEVEGVDWMKESERYCPRFWIIDMPAVQTNQWLFFLQRANRKNVELVARLAVFQMLHDTSQGIDILSKKESVLIFLVCASCLSFKLWLILPPKMFV